MTSLEQEESKGNDSVSDYDEHWGDNENWGDMDTPGEGKNSITPGINRQIPNNTDGWDNEEWGSLEEEPVVSLTIFFVKKQKKSLILNFQAELASPSETWNNTDFATVPESDNCDTGRINDATHRVPHKPQNSWEDCDFEPLESTGNIIPFC